MSEYIDREDLIEKIKKSYCIGRNCNSYNGVRCRSCEIYDMISEIEDAPSANVVPVVLCRDCIYYKDAVGISPLGWCKHYKRSAGGAWYCHWGKRRKSDDV